MASDTFGTIIKWGVIIGGAYLAYSYFFAAPAVAATVPATPATPVTPPATPVAAPAPPANPGVGVCPTSTCPPTTDSLAVQQQKVLAAAGANGASAQTASVWNWYFNTAYGLPTTTTWLLGDNGQPMTITAYLALRQSQGFSGYAGLGAVRPVMGARRNYIPAGVPMVRSINYRRAA